MTFRNFVQELWMANREERLTYKESSVTLKQYWDTYKWWLRVEYRLKTKARK